LGSVSGSATQQTPSSGRKNTDGSQRQSISRQSVDAAFRDVFDLLGITGASTHSFRRSMATHLSREGLTLADIAQITGHKDLASLSHYLDADDEKALSALQKIARRSR
jgi:integrase/recombinase XerD